MRSHEAVIYLQVALHETVPKLDNHFSNLSRYSGLNLESNLEDIYNKFIDSYMNLMDAYGTKHFGEPVEPSAAGHANAP